MKKKIAFIALLALLFCNAAAAKYSDEYKAQYPKRVKVTTEQTSSGQKSQKVTFKLFDRKLQSGRLKLDVEKNSHSPDLCFLTFSTYGDSHINPIKQLTYGDGQQTHEINIFYSDVLHPAVGRFAELAIATVRPEDLQKAVILNAGIITIINESSKEWKEWKAAVDAAAKIIRERWVYNASENFKK